MTLVTSMRCRTEAGVPVRWERGFGESVAPRR